MRQVLVAFLLLFAAPTWAETRDPGTHFFQPKFGDFKAELAAAKAQGKKGIFLFYEMDDCPFCARMESTILNQADVQDAYRAQFLLYSIDINGDTAISRSYVQARHQGLGDKSHAIFDTSGEYTDRWERRAEGWRIVRRDARWDVFSGDSSVLM